MHVRGKSYRYDLETPDGKKETLLDIPAYDFNWQTTYALAKPRPVSEGSRILCTATYDNSEANLNNPDPTKTVTWGDQTWDEMMIGYYHYSVPLEKSATGEKGEQSGKATPMNRAAGGAFEKVRSTRYRSLTENSTGTDVPRSLIKVFDQLDKNADQILTREEVVTGE